MRSDDAVATVIRLTGALIFAGSTLGAIGLLGTQIYGYMRTGAWAPSGLLDELGRLFDWSWAMAPFDWLGIHSMLNAINAGVALFVVGVCAGLLLGNFESQ